MQKKVAMILAGGVGSRLGADVPKQYLIAGEKPIIVYSLERFSQNERIDEILIVTEQRWIPYVEELIHGFQIKKIVAIVQGGSSRQHSVLKGLQYLKENGYEDDTIVLIHNAACPGVDDALIERVLDKIQYTDGVLPVVPMRYTIYVSKNAEKVDALLDRRELFAGQTPEAFRLEKYYRINAALSEEELAAVTGSSEIAFSNGLEVQLVPGDEMNYKITTKEDLQRFVQQIGGTESFS